MTKDEAMKLALRSIRELVLDNSDDAPALQGVRMRKQKAEKALREALAQPEQEPVAGEWIVLSESVGKLKELGWNDDAIHKANTPQRTWIGLTKTQVKLLWEGVQEEAVKSGDSLNWVFYTHINEALKEKNT